MAKGKVATKSATATQAPPDPKPQPPLNWPTIEAPSTPLDFKEVGPSLLVIDNFFSPQSLKVWRSFTSTLPLTASPPQKKGEAYRTNHRFGIDSPEFAARLWSDSSLGELCENELQSCVKGKKAKGLNSNIRIYKYEQGAEFGPHYDDDFYDPVTRTRSEWTLLIYLTGIGNGVQGGETVFHPSAGRHNQLDTIVVPLEAGRALLHRHGQNCMLHEGRKVEHGVKWVLRSDVMFG